MKGWKRTLTLLFAVVLVNTVTYVVVVENQHSGLYPVDADSIGIPIMSTLVLSALVLPVLVLIGLLPGAQFMVRLCARGLWWRIAVGSRAWARTLSFIDPMLRQRRHPFPDSGRCYFYLQR